MLSPPFARGWTGRDEFQHVFGPKPAFAANLDRYKGVFVDVPLYGLGLASEHGSHFIGSHNQRKRLNRWYVHAAPAFVFFPASAVSTYRLMLRLKSFFSISSKSTTRLNFSSSLYA